MSKTVLTSVADPQAGPVRVRRFPMAAPDDISALEQAFDREEVDPTRILGFWCKTQGNGLLNDVTKPYTDLLLRLALARRLNLDADTIRDRVFILVSGGSEGIVSPHLVVFEAVPAASPSEAVGLAAAVVNDTVAIDDTGTEAQARLTAAMVGRAMTAAKIARPEDVGVVVVRAPSNPSRPGHDMLVRAAGALGVAHALGEVDAAALSADGFGRRTDLFASRAFVVARHDGPTQQVMVIGNAPGGNPAFAIAGGALNDPIDTPTGARLLASLGLVAAPQLPFDQSGHVVAVISKGDAPLSGRVREMRHVMAVDNDVAMHRHARAAYGAMLSSLVGHTACLVSGGAEHHGPADGGFVAFIAYRPETEA